MARTSSQAPKTGQSAWATPGLHDPRYSQALERGLAILDVFTPERPVLGIADIADELGMSRSTTHRYVITLVALGYLEQGASRKYRLGLRVTNPGMSALRATSPIARATRAIPPLAQIQRLLMLDDFWTASLEDARSGDPTQDVDHEDLVALAKEMELALRDMPSAAAQVIELLDESPPEFDAHALQAIASSDERVADALGTILSEDLGGLDARRAFTAACRFVQAETDSEIEHLAGKRIQLEQGELPDPDLRINFRCIATLVGIGALCALAAAGATTVIGTPIAIGLGVLGAGALLVEKWEDSGCKSKAQDGLQAFA